MHEDEGHQDVTVHAVTVNATVTVGDDISITIGYSADRPWQEMWRRLDRSIARLRSMTAPESHTSNVDLVDEVDSFFLACWHLADWLDHDAALPAVDKKVIKDWFLDNEEMTICHAYANTSKHVTLDGDRLHARPDQSTSSQRGHLLRIAYWSDSKPERVIDALQLAETCLEHWQRFFKAHGIEEQS